MKYPRTSCPYYANICKHECECTVLVPHGFCNLYRAYQEREKEAERIRNEGSKLDGEILYEI